MSQCSQCRCDLPDFQELCQPCYDRRYASLGQKSKPFVKRLTIRSALIFGAAFAYSLFRVRIGRYIDPYPLTIGAALIIGFAGGSILVYLDSRRP